MKIFLASSRLGPFRWGAGVLFHEEIMKQQGDSWEGIGGEEDRGTERSPSTARAEGLGYSWSVCA